MDKDERTPEPVAVERILEPEPVAVEELRPGAFIALLILTLACVACGAVEQLEAPPAVES